MAIAATETDLGSPAGEVNNPALVPPRPALKVIRDTLPQPLAARISRARDLVREQRRREAEPPLTTAEPALDRLLAGGLARGSLVELVGRRSSGRFSLALAALAAATGVGEAAALVDLGDSLDPRTAAAAGVDLSRLLWLRPRHVKEALRGTEAVLATGFPLVVVDLGNPPVRGGRGTEGAWLRLARCARDHESALLVSSPYRVSGPAAAAVLAAGLGRAVWRGRGRAPRLLEALTSRLTLEKHRGRAPGASDRLELRVVEAPAVEAPAVEAPAAEAPSAETPAVAAPATGDVLRLQRPPGVRATPRKPPQRSQPPEGRRSGGAVRSPVPYAPVEAPGRAAAAGGL